ncbi:MAG TPA: apolipoprotein N-acyltransferase [Streptosporangiaceae bacterium]|nr:apolipoprotein N-acyltransferase [Streptosporangiaceae bacterium]
MSGAAGWLPGWLSAVAALAAGLALAAAFPPVGIWPLAMTGPALLTLAVWRQGRLRTFLLGLICGGAFFTALLSWLVNVAWYAWGALAVTETVIFAVLALALRPLLRLRAWPLAVAGWWVAQEAVRDRFPWGGFPWGRLAMSQAGAPTAGWAAIGGPPLLTFLLALAGAWVAYSGLRIAGQLQPGRADPGQARWRESAAGAAAAVLAVGIALAGNLAWHRSPGPGPTAIVATIQGNVPHARNLPNLLRASTVTENHTAATLKLAGQVRAGRRPAPDVVIWPENSTDIDPSLSAQTYQTIAIAVDAINRPVLVGAVLDNPVRNAGQLWLPGHGPVQDYIKRQLVPFGEVIPMRGLLDTFTSLPSLQPTNFTPGHRAVVFHVGKVRLGDVICYEVGFDNLVRSEVLAGANLLTVQTNDADYELDGQLGETLQQLAMARMDAVWTGRSVAVASTTGVSAIIAPDGTVLTASRTWQRTALEARIPLRSAFTPADRAGSWPELIIVGLTALAWCLALAGRALPKRHAPA